MKLMLIHGGYIPQDIKIEFLKKKGIPFFIYKKEEETSLYRKESDLSKINRFDEILIALKDCGDIYHIDHMKTFEYDEYDPDFDIIRYDKELIELVESDINKFMGIDIKEVPDGSQYRIYIDIDFGMEHLEIKDEADEHTA